MSINSRSDSCEYVYHSGVPNSHAKQRADVLRFVFKCYARFGSVPHSVRLLNTGKLVMDNRAENGTTEFPNDDCDDAATTPNFRSIRVSSSNVR